MSSQVWRHVPATGPVAWGWAVFAVIASPAPLALTWVAVDSSGSIDVAAIALGIWFVIGLALCAVPQRIVRGLGLGMAAAAVTWGAVLLVAGRLS